jgi:BA14K-like protein
MNRLWVFPLTLISSAAVGQTTGSLNPNPPVTPTAKEDVPPGGCMPIGLTASGEMVFPIQCAVIIERERGTVEQKPAVSKDSATAKSEAREESGDPVVTGVESVPLPKSRPTTTTMENDCRHFRSYNRASGKYTDYDGRRRSCR